MSKIAFIFPGQGSQKVGMGAEFVANDEASKAFYDQADQALNIKLSTLMLEGPQEELTLTYHAQPAPLTTGVMIASKLMEAGITPDYTAGHSLGEYGSFVIAGSLSFEEAVKIVHKRGLYMNEAVPAGQGAMGAILGMDEEPLKEVCAEITNNGDLVQLANLNCPGQIVISGTKAGVEKASQLAKEKGAKRAIPLDVSGPFHSELMKDAAIKLEKEIEQVEISQPNIPIISNVHAGILEDVESIKKEMVEQVYCPVQWERDVRKMLECGVTTFIECGPGKVLSGLVKKIDRSVKSYCVYDIATFEEVVKELKG